MKKNKNNANTIKLIITIVIVFCFVWLLIVSPMMTFHKNEQILTDAAKRYFELNSNLLPTGERVKTVKLNTLYHQSYIKKDLYIPYTHKTCSVENSWVKVRRENNEYRYYTYLECGLLSSSVDHKGPVITLNGDKEMKIGKNDTFKDPGIKSVVDNVDGKMDISKVSVKNDLNSSEVGTYEIIYTAFDNLNNKTEVVRKVSVVQTLYSTVKTDLKETSNYVGEPDNNYLRLSNMLFRIVGIDENKNVMIVSDEDLANVSYSKIEDWLSYFYDQLNDATKKMIIEKSYCNMSLSETALDITQCSSYTKNKKVYIPSVIDINKAKAGNNNFMKPYTISWVANSKNKKEAYVTRNIFFGDEKGKNYLAYGVNDNYGVRPMMTISGESLILSGEGTIKKPYTFGDVDKAKGGDLVNSRYTGEYLSIDGALYRIISVEKDKTTKVIAENTLGSMSDNVTFMASLDEDIITYDPKDKKSVAYFIHNKASEYLDTKYFTSHEIEVPIYKKKIIYGEETSTKKYKVLLSAPNMFEIFSAQPQHSSTIYSYWLINSSLEKRITGAITDIGVPYNGEVTSGTSLNIRVVAYLKKNSTISTGSGTLYDPYVVQ